MVFRDFNDRAIECLQLATRTNSANDRTLFNQMAFAWLGRMDQLSSAWIVPRPVESRPVTLVHSSEGQYGINLSHEVSRKVPTTHAAKPPPGGRDLNSRFTRADPFHSE
jgi:hypothetical protein